MNLKEKLIATLSQLDKSVFDFTAPASEKSLADLQRQFGLQELPLELEAFYRHTNGISEILNGEIIGELLWPIDKTIETNNAYRKYPDFKRIYKPFETLLFFSDAGNGDLFGLAIQGGRIEQADVFCWNHEDDSRNWVAPNLTAFIEGWTNGTITV